MSYGVYQWHSRKEGNLDQIISLDGGLNLDDEGEDIGPRDDIAEKFLAAAGPLQTTDGHLILPYCNHSPMDSWDHLALCGVDIYDLSGLGLRFVETRPAHPMARALATAIEYARKHDTQALQGYVATQALIDRLIHADLPDAVEGLKITKNPDDSETVIMGEGDDASSARFIMVRHDAGWTNVYIQYAVDYVPVMFDRYRVSEIYTGKPHPAVLVTQRDRLYRSDLRARILKGKVEFAWHYITAGYSRGTPCLADAIIDALQEDSLLRSE